MDEEKLFDRAAWRLHSWGVRPNHISFLQVPLLAGLAWYGYRGDIIAFGAFQFAIIFVDGADGILARRTYTVTRQGHLLDSLFDILGIGITLWVCGVLYPYVSQVAFALLFVNFLVYIQNEIQQTKSVTYSRGPASVGLLVEPMFPGLLMFGLLLPLVIGVALVFSRLAWRQRTWNWYQFFTAGRRREYKAVPRHERAGLGSGQAFPPRPSSPMAPAPRQTGPAETPPAEEPAQAPPEHG